MVCRSEFEPIRERFGFADGWFPPGDEVPRLKIFPVSQARKKSEALVTRARNESGPESITAGFDSTGDVTAKSVATGDLIVNSILFSLFPVGETAW